MARDWFDSGNHGITLGLEYGTLIDTVTGGAITADTVAVKLSNAEAWIKTDDWPFTDSSNKLSWAGAMVTDGSDSNINASTSTSKKLKELSCTAQTLRYGSTFTGTISLTLTGIEAAGETLSGSRTFTMPMRPYHAPATPGVTIDGAGFYCTGHQLNAAADGFWDYTYWALETNDVWAAAVLQEGNAASFAYAAAANSRYRGAVAAGNANAGGASGYSGYYYTAPNTPTAMAAARAAGSTLVNLSWGANGSRYVGDYLLYRSLNGGAYSLLKSVAATATTDTVPLGSVASYYVVARTPLGVNQAISGNSAAAAINSGYNVPNAPGVALVRTGATTATITITGNQNTATNDRYTAQLDWQIQINGAAFGGGATNLAGTTTSIQVTGLPADSQIRVQARFGNSGGEGAWAQSGYLYTTPDAPSAFVAERADAASSTVNLSWIDNAAYETNVLLEKQVGAGAWSQVGTFAANAATGTVVQSQAEGAKYRIRAVTSDNQYSAYSAEQEVGVAFVTNKNYARIGDAPLDYCYVGDQRIRRIIKGGTVIWEDGDA